MSMINESVTNKWSAVLDHDSLPKIKDKHRRAVTAMILENQEKERTTERKIEVYIKEAYTKTICLLHLQHRHYLNNNCVDKFQL